MPLTCSVVVAMCAPRGAPRRDDDEPASRWGMSMRIGAIFVCFDRRRWECRNDEDAK